MANQMAQLQHRPSPQGRQTSVQPLCQTKMIAPTMPLTLLTMSAWMIAALLGVSCTSFQTQMHYHFLPETQAVAQRNRRVMLQPHTWHSKWTRRCGIQRFSSSFPTTYSKNSRQQVHGSSKVHPPNPTTLERILARGIHCRGHTPRHVPHRSGGGHRRRRTLHHDGWPCIAVRQRCAVTHVGNWPRCTAVNVPCFTARTVMLAFTTQIYPRRWHGTCAQVCANGALDALPTSCAKHADFCARSAQRRCTNPWVFAIILGTRLILLHWVHYEPMLRQTLQMRYNFPLLLNDQ